MRSWSPVFCFSGAILGPLLLFRFFLRETGPNFWYFLAFSGRFGRSTVATFSFLNLLETPAFGLNFWLALELVMHKTIEKWMAASLAKRKTPHFHLPAQDPNNLDLKTFSKHDGRSLIPRYPHRPQHSPQVMPSASWLPCPRCPLTLAKISPKTLYGQSLIHWALYKEMDLLTKDDACHIYLLLLICQQPFLLPFIFSPNQETSNLPWQDYLIFKAFLPRIFSIVASSQHILWAHFARSFWL